MYERAAPEQDKANPFLAAVIKHGGEQIVEVWPENWRAFSLFTKLRTQWNAGMGGPIGLRYEAVYPLIDREAENAEDWNDLFDDVRVIESAALAAINSRET